MKNPEEYLKQLYITQDGEPDSIHDFVENVELVIAQAQIDAYNEALEDAVENVKLKYEEPYSFSYSDCPEISVNKNSILKLKK